MEDPEAVVLRAENVVHVTEGCTRKRKRNVKTWKKLKKKRKDIQPKDFQLFQTVVIKDKRKVVKRILSFFG
ncbi:hypothetical protein J6590_035075 [Homalodisca vitripennis]|nr:hypothetical protein J6590_035075 [Homalodisca vitripennis]